MRLEENMQIKKVKSTKCMRCEEKQSRGLRPIPLLVSIIVFVIISGCISQQPEEVLRVNTEIYEGSIAGVNESQALRMFTVIKGNISEAKDSFGNIITKKATQQSAFSVDDNLNFVISRGITRGGFGINVSKVEKQGNVYTVYATYIDIATDLGVVGHPIAIIPIGKLATGDYKLKLKVTKVYDYADGTKIIREVIETEKELGVFNFSVKPAEEGIDRNTTIPNIPIIGVETYSTPAYRGTSTSVRLFISGNNVTEGTGISLDYKTELLHTDGYLESEPVGIELTPEQKQLISKRTIKAWEVPEKIADSNLTINISPEAVDGDYYITVNAKYRGLVVGSRVLSFKIGKGFNLASYSTGKKYLPERFAGTEKLLHLATWDIGYTRAQFPPLNETEKAEAIAIAINDSYLKGKKYEITEIISEFHDFETSSGFFPVVTVDAGEPEELGEIINFIIDLEEKQVIKIVEIPRKPAQYLAGEAFDELAGNFTKKWDAGNFAGFWRDSEANVSTENLTINQSTLNSSHRVIGKYNLIYTTRPLPLKYQVYAHVNQTPLGTEGFYSAIGWQGEKYTFLGGNRFVRVIFEQSSTDVKIMHAEELWRFGEDYKIFVNSIDSKALVGQGWFSLFKNNDLIEDAVFGFPYTYAYIYSSNYSTPIFVTYISVNTSSGTDGADFRYTWLRSQNITEIKEGDTFGIMEVTSVKNGTIELRNKNQIDLSPGNTVLLMGDISIQVASSETGLLFYPTKGRI
jgi:S-layer protein (TIGR01567 family)